MYMQKQIFIKLEQKIEKPLFLAKSVITLKKVQKAAVWTTDFCTFSKGF